MVILKSPEEIEKIRASGQLIGKALEHIGRMVAIGVTTMELSDEAERFLISSGAKPAFKGYKRARNEPPFPACLCTSINNEVVHGIPSPKRRLCNGDIISLDLGAAIDGYYADAAVTLPVGKISQGARKLLEVTQKSLEMGINMAVPGKRLQDISYAVQSYVEGFGFSVVRDFVGHGIGRTPHEDPQVPNFGKPGRGRRLVSGIVIAIEPMVNMGTHEVSIKDDKWTAVTADNSLSAHFEHTIAITDNGPQILTQVSKN
ncbi:type I methionyl aminopeptidase [bacterium]|nr:type I methionyl aminopeptidase [bacterium]